MISALPCHANFKTFVCRTPPGVSAVDVHGCKWVCTYAGMQGCMCLWAHATSSTYVLAYMARFCVCTRTSAHCGDSPHAAGVTRPYQGLKHIFLFNSTKNIRYLGSTTFLSTFWQTLLECFAVQAERAALRARNNALQTAASAEISDLQVP